MDEQAGASPTNPPETRILSLIYAHWVSALVSLFTASVLLGSMLSGMFAQPTPSDSNLINQLGRMEERDTSQRRDIENISARVSRNDARIDGLIADIAMVKGLGAGAIFILTVISTWSALTTAKLRKGG